MLPVHLPSGICSNIWLQFAAQPASWPETAGEWSQARFQMGPAWLPHLCLNVPQAFQNLTRASHPLCPEGAWWQLVISFPLVLPGAGVQPFLRGGIFVYGKQNLCYNFWEARPHIPSPRMVPGRWLSHINGMKGEGFTEHWMSFPCPASLSSVEV